MKTTCLTFAVIGWAALMSGTGYASSFAPASRQTSAAGAAKPTSATPHNSQHFAPSADGKSRRDSQPSEEQRSLHGSVRNHNLSHGNPAGTPRSLQVPNGHGSSASQSVESPHQTGVIRPVSPEKAGLIETGAVNKALGFRENRTIRPVTQSLASIRHRGANPPAIGGATNSGRTNSATINGTGMHRKP
jgi:hypothetical protein